MNRNYKYMSYCTVTKVLISFFVNYGQIICLAEEKSVLINLESFNEKDIMGKLNTMHITIDSTTGEAKHLKDLNSLGRRKPVPGDAKCKADNENSKSNILIMTVIKSYLYRIVFIFNF